MGLSLPRGTRLRSGALLAFAVLSVPTTTSLATAAEAMLAGGPTSQPIGHFEFCRAHVNECTIQSTNTRPEHMTNKLWRRLVAVNLSVNKHVKALDDFDHFGKAEVWAYPSDGFGDCEDYVLEKRRMLLQRGVPISDLLITIVLQDNGEGHAVLTVRTDRGDFILDSSISQVVRWDYAKYRYVKRQASNYTGHWVSILDGNDSTVGALR
jgi:Predicted periplasmic protein